MTGLRGGKNPKRETAVESHPFGFPLGFARGFGKTGQALAHRNAQGWRTHFLARGQLRGLASPGWTDECVRPYVGGYSFSEQPQSAGGTWAFRKSATRLYASI
jgi:hypothetical protein